MDEKRNLTIDDLCVLLVALAQAGVALGGFIALVAILK